MMSSNVKDFYILENDQVVLFLCVASVRSSFSAQS